MLLVKHVSVKGERCYIGRMTLHEPKMLEEMKYVLLKLKVYAGDHTITDELGKNIDELVAAGALPPESGTFLHDSGVRFYGFSSATSISDDTPVLEMDLPTCRLVGTSEGAVLEYRKRHGSA